MNWNFERKHDALVEVTCDGCGMVIKMRRNVHKHKIKKGQKMFFCGRECQSRWRVGKPRP